MLAREFFYSETSKRNLRLQPDKLANLQFKKAKKLLIIAYETVPLYHNKLKKASLHPNDIQTIKDYTKVPTLTKTEIQSNPTSNTIHQGASQNRLIWRSTSGSTGIPLKVGLSRKTLELEGAIWYRALSENGLRIFDKRAIIGDPRCFPIKKHIFENMGLIKRQHLSIFNDAQTQLTQLENFQPDIIKAYPSSLTILADYSPQRTSALKPRMVFTTSEILDKHSRDFINSSFETEVFDCYSCTEFALLAYECKHHNGYHINADSVLLEFLEDGEPVDFGERGEIVCTGLLNQAMPLIRYEIGDVGVPLRDCCPCGRTLPLMQVVEGRADDFLVTTNGKVISPTVFFPYPFRDYEAIKQFRVIQPQKERVIIQVIPRMGIQNKQQILQDAEANIKHLFGESMQVEFQLLDKIERDSSGKLRKIVSNLHLGSFACRHYN
ncbi:MAG: phenylacetate--CoA ligase family protein [Candidatus Bathyarchaeia archaeon]